MERRRLRMLKMYPVPPGWKEVPDLHTFVEEIQFIDNNL